ncbi:hypothetical protein JCM3775_001364 [Rhodotorula graminis]
MFAPSPTTSYTLPRPPPTIPPSDLDHPDPAEPAVAVLSPAAGPPPSAHPCDEHITRPLLDFRDRRVQGSSPTAGSSRVDEDRRRDLPQVGPVRAHDVLALASLRPRNFAVEVLSGAEEDWLEVDEVDSAADGEQRDFERMIALVAGSAKRREPSMYPGQGHLFALERNTSSRFFLPAQKMCIAYLYPWEVPPLPKLSRFAAQTYDSLLPVLPLLHRPSLDLKAIAPPLAFALSVVGAGLFESSKPFHNEMSHIKREFAAAELTHVVLHEDERLAAAQTLLLYQLVGCFSDSQAEREYSRRHHGLLIQTFLDMLPPDHAVPLDLNLPPDDLERVWRAWIAHETHVRIAYLCYLLDLEVGRAAGDEHRLLPHSHSAISALPLPSSDSLWNAESASTWSAAFTRLRRYHNGRGESSATFKSVLDALLCSSPPPQGSSGARALASLTQVAPFAISVLYQTLEGLRRQITTSQRLLVNLAAAPPTSIAPGELLPGSSALAGGHGGILEAATASAKESQVRIAFGLRVLKMLGGAAASQEWFSGIHAMFR